LESAVSKIGALDFGNPTRIDEIKSEFLRDALADFNENNDNLLADLNEEEQHWIQDRIQADIAKVLEDATDQN
jgi:hypothetical protein